MYTGSELHIHRIKQFPKKYEVTTENKLIKNVAARGKHQQNLSLGTSTNCFFKNAAHSQNRVERQAADARESLNIYSMISVNFHHTNVHSRPFQLYSSFKICYPYLLYKHQLASAVSAIQTIFIYNSVFFVIANTSSTFCFVCSSMYHMHLHKPGGHLC